MPVVEKREFREAGFVPALAMLVLFLAFCSGSSPQRGRMYEIRMKGAAKVLDAQARSSVSAGRAVLSAWRYAEVSDIDRRTAEREIVPGLSQLRAERAAARIEIAALMEGITPPIEPFTEARRKLQILHDEVMTIMDQVDRPSGGIDEFESTLNETENRIFELLRDLDALLAVETR